MSGGSNAPVIIKRKKVVGGDGHHGGAWKVAYADFVTAMMAFFMLMWLLNATTEQQRKGIADYFSPTVPINRVSGGGSDMFGGDSIMSSEALAENGTGEPQGIPLEGAALGSEAAAAEVARLEEIERTLLGIGGESLIQHEALRHVVTRITDEGLIIEIFARDGAPLFRENTAEPMPVLVDLTQVFASVFDMVTNPVAVDGYTRTQPLVVAHNPVWDLTSGRAESVRALLVEGGLADARVHRLTGHGDRSPVTEDALSVRNDRIEITLLRSAN